MGEADRAAGMTRPAAKNTANKTNIYYLSAGWTAALVSLARYPFIFGVAAVAAGVMAGKNGSGKAGIILILSSIICMGLGLIFSNALYDYLRFAFGI
jgi:hypothetical protein